MTGTSGAERSASSSAARQRSMYGAESKVTTATAALADGALGARLAVTTVAIL